MITGRECLVGRNRRHIHLTQEPPVTILNGTSEPVTMQSSANFPIVARESDDNQKQTRPPDANSSTVLRRSTWVGSVPVWHKDYVMSKEMYCRFIYS